MDSYTVTSTVDNIVTTGITKIVINPTRNSTAPSENPTFEGRSFGTVGMYEKLRGRVYGQLNPNDTRNRGYKVSGSFSEMSGGNNPTTAKDAGRAFLLNQGYTIAWSGWDPEVTTTGDRDLLRIFLPTTTNSDNSSITGPSYEYIVFDYPSSTSYTTAYNTSSTDATRTTLTMKCHLTDPPIIIPPSNWTWTSNNTISLLPRNTTFQQSWIYELTYIAQDPYVAGIGFAVTRDFVSFLRSARTDNPLAGDIKRTISWSASQPARYMNDFIWLGFNEDLNGQLVFDGVFN